MQGKVAFEKKCKRVTNVFENGILEYSALSTCDIKLLNFLTILPAQVQSNPNPTKLQENHMKNWIITNITIKHQQNYDIKFALKATM